MATLRSRGMGYHQIVAACEEILEASLVTDKETGGRVLTNAAIDSLLENTDDPSHVLDPLGQAVFCLIRKRNAKILIPDS